MTDLHETMIDIARSTGHLEIVHVGPNAWEDVGPEDFGPRHDFEVDDHGSIVIVTAISNAALQWQYYHLPEDCPRWSVGFVIEPRYAGDVIRGMQRDGLMSEEDYVAAMQENELQNAQGEEA